MFDRLSLEFQSSLRLRRLTTASLFSIQGACPEIGFQRGGSLSRGKKTSLDLLSLDPV
jgi:hypothetical protein